MCIGVRIQSEADGDDGDGDGNDDGDCDGDHSTRSTLASRLATSKSASQLSQT